MAEIPVYVVDAFTEEPFRGNPAAVCLVPKSVNLTDGMMQTIAAEMNLSETSFIQSDNFKEDNEFSLRWFTPTNEVPLCGHATLATSAALLYMVGNVNHKIEFNSLSGKLAVEKKGDLLCLDFPLNTPSAEVKSEWKHLIELVAPFDWVTDVHLSSVTKKLLLRLDDSITRENLESLNPDVKKMMDAENSGSCKGVIVTLASNGRYADKHGNPYDFVSRYFAPWNGIPEDPVTGSAHTVLAGYWGRVFDKKNLYARQCSKRGGEIHMELQDPRVLLMGHAKVVLKGSIML